MAFSFFFRDEQPLILAIELMLPLIYGHSRINIWSAGCAMGQEPYTLAILIRERMGPHLFHNVRIYASDIDTEGIFGSIIRTGKYPAKDLERIPEQILSRYFLLDSNDPEYFQISPEIMGAVEFHIHNILSLQPIRNNMHLIVCKNVMLHFQPDERKQVWKMFYESLEKGGLLLHEQTQKIPDEISDQFRQVVQNAQLFQKI